MHDLEPRRNSGETRIPRASTSQNTTPNTTQDGPCVELPRIFEGLFFKTEVGKEGRSFVENLKEKLNPRGVTLWGEFKQKVDNVYRGNILAATLFLDSENENEKITIVRRRFLENGVYTNKPVGSEGKVINYVYRILLELESAYGLESFEENEIYEMMYGLSENKFSHLTTYKKIILGHYKEVLKKYGNVFTSLAYQDLAYIFQNSDIARIFVFNQDMNNLLRDYPELFDCTKEEDRQLILLHKYFDVLHDYLVSGSKDDNFFKSSHILFYLEMQLRREGLDVKEQEGSVKQGDWEDYSEFLDKRGSIGDREKACAKMHYEGNGLEREVLDLQEILKYFEKLIVKFTVIESNPIFKEKKIGVLKQKIIEYCLVILKEEHSLLDEKEKLEKLIDASFFLYTTKSGLGEQGFNFLYEFEHLRAFAIERLKIVENDIEKYDLDTPEMIAYQFLNAKQKEMNEMKGPDGKPLYIKEGLLEIPYIKEEVARLMDDEFTNLPPEERPKRIAIKLFMNFGIDNLPGGYADNYLSEEVKAALTDLDGAGKLPSEDLVLNKVTGIGETPPITYNGLNIARLSTNLKSLAINLTEEEVKDLFNKIKNGDYSVFGKLKDILLRNYLKLIEQRGDMMSHLLLGDLFHVFEHNITVAGSFRFNQDVNQLYQYDKDGFNAENRDDRILSLINSYFGAMIFLVEQKAVVDLFGPAARECILYLKSELKDEGVDLESQPGSMPEDIRRSYYEYAKSRIDNDEEKMTDKSFLEYYFDNKDGMTMSLEDMKRIVTKCIPIVNRRKAELQTWESPWRDIIIEFYNEVGEYDSMLTSHKTKLDEKSYGPDDLMEEKGKLNDILRIIKNMLYYPSLTEEGLVRGKMRYYALIRLKTIEDEERAFIR